MTPLKRTDVLALIAAAAGILTGLLTWYWTASGWMGIIVGAGVTGAVYQVALKQKALETIVDSRPLTRPR